MDKLTISKVSKAKVLERVDTIGNQHQSKGRMIQELIKKHVIITEEASFKHVIDFVFLLKLIKNDAVADNLDLFRKV